MLGPNTEPEDNVRAIQITVNAGHVDFIVACF